MFLGHYGVAFAAKRVAPQTSLGWLAFAAQFLDELWPILLLAGVEHVRIVPGLMAASPLDFVSYPISHSLLTTLVWGVAVGGAYFALRRDRRGATVLGLAVLSHWFLDVPVHQPDLPLWPGSSIRVGLGVWNSIPATIALESAVFFGGLAIYMRSTSARDGVGRWGLLAMVAVLVVIFASGFMGPPPPSERAIGLMGLGLWLFVPWSYWVDRHRERVHDIRSNIR
jgi:LexA-binding, inner membrane-associated putative hydrolase